MEKGYREERLNSIIHKLAVQPRDNFLRDKDILTTTNNREWNFISGFHSQFREVEEIFINHWHILRMDKVLSAVLPQKPGFIYGKAQSFSDKIVRKILDPPPRPSSFWDGDGFYACKKCRAC